MKDIFDTFSPSGNENKIREILKQRFRDAFDEITTDNVGNLIARSGNGAALCIECGMDSTGVMVVATEKDKAYFAAVGAIKPEEIVGREIAFANGQTGVVECSEDTELASAKISDLYTAIDTAEINIGDFGAVVSQYAEEDCGFTGYGLKNRIGLAAVCKAIENAGRIDNATVLVSAQKRLGGRGLRAFFGANTFDRIISVDGCREDGCTIIAKDARAVAARELRNRLEEIAAECGIYAETAVSEDNFFMEQISISGGGDCAAIGISVVCEDDEPQRVNKADFGAAVELLTAILKMGGQE